MSIRTREAVTVVGRGPVDLSYFVCESVGSARAIRRIRYDENNSYMVIQLGSNYFHYCGVEPHKVHKLLHAESVGRQLMRI